MLGAQALARGEPGVAVGVVGVGGLGKAQVRERVLVGAVDARVVGQGGEPLQGGVHLCSRAAEEPSAAAAEEGVSGEHEARAGIGDVGRGMAGHGEHLERQPERRKRDRPAAGKGVGEPFDARIRGAENAGITMFRKLRDTADVIRVVMREEDRRQGEVLGFELAEDDRSVARVDDRGEVSCTHQPDIVILKSGQRKNFERMDGRMSGVHGEDGLAGWLATAQGQYVLRWEQERFDAMVADIFGYNALQLGLPAFDFLRASRIAFRFASGTPPAGQITTEAHALPFATGSLDLVVLPHVLEFAEHPHQVLREVERVLVPEGSVILTGFNPYSLWGLRRTVARRSSGLPWRGHFFSPLRIKDWLTLLSFETQTAGFGCYAPALASERWLGRWRFMDRAGGRWWPVCGGVYLLHGIKRVQGMRLIAPSWRDRKAKRNGLAPVARRGRGAIGGARKSGTDT